MPKACSPRRVVGEYFRSLDAAPAFLSGLKRGGLNSIERMNTIIPNQLRQKLGAKTKGSLTVLLFMYECTRRGAAVAVPIADDDRYDLIVDNRNWLSRVQVKTSSKEKKRRGFCFSGRRRSVDYIPAAHIENGSVSTKRRAFVVRPYLKGEVDLVVTCVQGIWYMYTDPHLFPHNVRIYPDKPNPAKDNWEALGLTSPPIDGQAELAAGLATIQNLSLLCAPCSDSESAIAVA
jgi:PD-(D/E)XK endonuclease